jgi:hypothetical protein
MHLSVAGDTLAISPSISARRRGCRSQKIQTGHISDRPLWLIASAAAIALKRCYQALIAVGFGSPHGDSVIESAQGPILG